ncbi:MAG: hypothetical protein JRJ15_09280 [Deltaproteobacteria bacterium]|nr:hypothetical protein [Deltaproteobacteria bacterium]
MKARDLRILFVLMIVSISITGLGCASNGVNLIKNGAVTLERIPSKGYYISHVEVYQNDNELVLHGNVKRRPHSNTGTGHVDIAIVSPDGEILEEIITSYRPRIISKRRLRKCKSYFIVSLSIVPPKGSIVRVAYHRNSKPDSRTFSCGENRAASEAGL